MRAPIKGLFGALSLSVLVVGCAVVTASRSPSPIQSSQASVDESRGFTAHRVGAGERLPLVFIENQGQVDARARFYARTGDQTLWLTDEGIVFDMVRAHRRRSAHSKVWIVHAEERDRLVFRQRLVGANVGAAITAQGPRPGVSNFFGGDDPARWRTGVRSYGEVTYRDIYPGIDLRLYGNGRALEQEFIVHPGADPTRIRVAYEGVSGLRTADRGGIRIQTGFGAITERAPRMYQQIDGMRVEVTGRFRLAGQSSYVFDIGSYRSDVALVIDPTLEYSTYLGGNSSDYADDIAVDASGNVYVTGYTLSANFPVVSPLQDTCVGCSSSLFDDAYVTRIDASGSIVYSTYLGGSSVDRGLGVAVDVTGNAYVTGYTLSTDFPLASPLQGANAGAVDVFVAKIDASGGALVYSTYVGGSGSEFGQDIAIDATGDAYVTGFTASFFDFPLESPIQPTCANEFGLQDAFVTKIDASGGTIGFSTCFGGSARDQGEAIAVDTVGNVYVAGYTESDDFPTAPATSPIQASLVGARDAFVTKIDIAAATIVYSTYLGGNLGEIARGVAVDGNGAAYVTGQTSSTDFPRVNAYRPFGVGSEAFVTKLNAAGSALIYSTYHGGNGDDDGLGMAIDISGNAHVVGSTASADFPVAEPLQATRAGGRDVFVTKFDAAGVGLVYSTYLGGSGDEWAVALALDAVGDAYVAGYTSSANFPTANPYQATNAGGIDAFVAKIAGEKADLVVTKTDAPDPVTVGSPLIYTIIVTNNGTSRATGVVLTDTLSGLVAFVSATPSQGSCMEAAGVVTCELGSLPAGAAATVIIVVTPTSPVTLLNTASVAANEPDPNPADNTALAITVVNPAFDRFPDISVLPVSHDFGSAPVGSNSAAVTFTIGNEGSAALIIGTLSLVGADAAQFAVTNDTCSGQSLAVSAMCTVDAVFSPTSEGTKNASLSIPSNDPDENPLLVAIRGAATQASGSDYTIQLHSRVFVPPPGMSPETRSRIVGLGAPRAHVLIQTTRIPTSQERSQLTTLGVRMLVHIPNLAWLASVPTVPAAVDAIAAHPAVRSMMQILPDDRIAGNLKDGIDPRLLFADGTVALEIVSYSDVPMAEVRGIVGPAVSEVLAESAPVHAILIRAPPAAIAALSQSDLLQLISEVAPPAQEDNDQIRIATRASNVQIVQDTVDGAGNLTGIQPGSPYALDGADILIGQWEPRHPDCSHPDFAGVLDATGTINGTNLRVTFGDTNADCRSASYTVAGDATIGDHATHVAGIVLGNGSQSVAAGGLPLQWRGMATNASIVAYQRPGLDVDGDGVADAAPLVTHRTQYDGALAAGILLSTNSWGFTHCHQVLGSCYETASAMYDDLVTDAANPLRDNAISVLGSAGNEGPTATDAAGNITGAASFSVRLPNSAKNTIVVGNVNSNTLTLLGGSSRGPVDDGRLKPEVVAPGDQAPGGDATRIRSTVMTITTDDAGGGGQGALCTSNGAPLDGVDDCAFPYDDVGGTSMSTPATTGAAALVAQQFRTRGSDPWPSTIKALLIHTAADQCCNDSQKLDADTPGPDYAFGYGLIDVQRTVDLVRDSRNGHVVQASGFGGWGSCAANAAQACDFDGNGVADDQTYTVNLPPGLANYRVTLAYDDLSAGGGLLARGAAALRNDLDLFLIGPGGGVYRPWILNPNNPTAPAVTGVDNLHPVEVVDIANPAGGEWTIVVRPTRLIPFDIDPPQRYSLIYESFETHVMIRDHGGDDGGVPSVRYEAGGVGWTPARYWRSPDITMEGGEAITPGVERAVRIAVTNRGQATVNDLVVQLYWANDGIGVDYADYLAHPMGSCVIAAIDPGERSDPADCRIPYTWNAGEVLIGEDGKTHVCLLATVEVDGDPLTYPGRATLPAGANPASFVPWDNNIAQQNVVQETIGPAGDDGSFDFEVKNPSENAAAIQIEQDTSKLPPGWEVLITPATIFTLAPGQSAFGQVRIVPPAGAPVGSRAEVSLHGRIAAAGGGSPDPSDRLGGFDAVVVVLGSAGEALQVDALQRLETASLTPLQIRVEGGIPRFVDARVPIPTTLPDDPVVRALDFVDRYSDLYRLEEPTRSLFLKRIASDPLTAAGGGTPDPSGRGWHLFFGQQRDGVPVYAATLALHLKGNQVTGTHGNYLARIPDLPPAVLTPLQAEAIARSNTRGQNVEVIGKSMSMYFNRGLMAAGGGDPDPTNSPTHLVWRVMTRGLRNYDGVGTAWMSLVDAHTGEVVLRLDESPTHDANKNFDIETVNNTTSSTCWWVPIVETDDDPWFDENGETDYPGLGDDAFGDGQKAFDFAHLVYDYYFLNFHRHSWGPPLGLADEAKVDVRVHVGNNWANARFVPVCDQLHFGDGQLANDTFAHEFTHAVTFWSSQLIYANQPGALNESYSDVFGAMVDDDWLHGEDTATGYARNLQNPPDKGQPDHMLPGLSGDGQGLRPGGAGIFCDPDDPDSNDCGWVHTNSGITNKAAYLITAGGVHNGIAVDGIGHEKVQRLYYDVLTTRIGFNADFNDAREQTVAQAQEYVDDGRHLFTARNVCSVMNAFASVGLGSADVDCDGTLDNADADDDGNGRLDGVDNCPGAANGFQSDLDGDGVGDACDTDLDGDQVGNFTDNCVAIANQGQADDDGDGIGNVCEDDDGDLVPNGIDNCPVTRNGDQLDTDGDGLGNACDEDDDDDDVPDDDDNCPLTANANQSDFDGDGVGDDCDNCTRTPNPDQADNDRDSFGDVCDNDDDNDGVGDSDDVCSLDPDPQQFDFDGNGMGLACDEGEAFMFSGDFGGIVNGVLTFRDLATPLRIPIFPCLQDCPDWIPESYVTEVAVTLPFAMPANIVDDRGFVITKGPLGSVQTLRFHPDADFFYRTGFASMIERTAARAITAEALTSQTQSEVETPPLGTTPYRGRSYFLEILPTEEVTIGQSYSASIRVTSGVSDVVPPTLTNIPPDPQNHEATSPSGAIVSYTAPTASDDTDPDPMVACAPPSGAVFPLGTTTVVCTATDDAGNSSSGSFRVVVRDTTPPTVTPPADVTVPATEADGAKGSASSALAAFLAGGSALDVVDVAPARLAPQVGGVDVDGSSLFPLGTTPVTFRFVDDSGNIGSATANAKVIVGTPRVSARIVSQGAYSAGIVYVDLQLTNTGNGNARNVRLDRLLFYVLSGGGKVTYNATLSPPLPYMLGSLDVGDSTTVRLYLNVSRNVKRFAIVEYGTLEDVTGTRFPFLGIQAVIP